MMDINNTTMINELVTVIIPVYNGEKYVKKCVESVVGQTYKNLEIILVDDGSSDNCGYICDSLKNSDERISVIHQENLGVSAARNRGIEVANGAFFSFIDCDDYFSENMIETLVRKAVDCNADIAMCGLQYVTEDEKEFDTLRSGKLNDCIWDEDDFWKETFGDNRILCVIPGNKLYRSSLFEGVKYQEGKIHEDERIIHELISQTERIVCVKERLYFYRQNPKSIMGVGYSRKRLDRIEAHIIRAGYFCDCGKQKFAETMIKMVVGLFVEAYQKLDMKDRANKDKYKELRKHYFKVFWQIARKSKSIVFILNGMSFFAGTKAYILTHPGKVYHEQ